VYPTTYHAPRKGKKIRASAPPTAHGPHRMARFMRSNFRGFVTTHGISGGAGIAQMARGTKPAKDDKPAAPARAAVPFIRASHEHTEGAFFDVSQQFIASAVALGPWDIPAYGFMRSILLYFSFSGGTLGAGALSADYPFNVFDEIALYDTNGAPMVGPYPSYSLYLSHTFGGYQWNPRPEDHPDYVGTINAAFMLRVPVEITAWDGLGSLANQNAAASYKLRATLAPSTTAYATAPTTAATVRVRGYLEAWSPPSQADVFGNPQEQFPPNHGTTQFWSRWVPVVSAGARTIILTRVGNLIRNLIFVTRDSAGARTTSHWPDPVTINWDARQLIVNEPQFARRGVMRERFGFAPPAGVFVFDLTHDQDGHPGNENRHLYYPTVQATRLEITGTFGTGASSLEVITNDIVPAQAPQTPVGGPVGSRS
jgi:hypothetical protein